MRGKSSRSFSSIASIGVGGIIRQSDRIPALAEVPRTDTGLTFAKWEMSSGPYLVIPLLGPSPFRDTVGLVGDCGFKSGELGDQIALASFGCWPFLTRTLCVRCPNNSAHTTPPPKTPWIAISPPAAPTSNIASRPLRDRRWRLQFRCSFLLRGTELRVASLESFPRRALIVRCSGDVPHRPRRELFGGRGRRRTERRVRSTLNNQPSSCRASSCAESRPPNRLKRASRA